MGHSPLNLAIVGGNRGSRFKPALTALEGRIRLAALCDVREDVLRQWKAELPWIETYENYERMLENPKIDAVLLASPMLLHARQSVQALRAGKHVLCEVIAAHTLEDAWELVETVEQTGRVYMMAENYAFERTHLAIRHMAEQGKFGEITYAEGGYIHDLRHTVHDGEGALTWRGDLHRAYDGMNYPTHSIGPVAGWLNLQREDGDRLESLSAFVSNSRSLRRYFHEKFGAGHPGSQERYWKQGDTAVTNIVTREGVLVTLRVDWTSARPHNMRHYALQGTEGAYLSRRHDREDDLVWFASSPATSEEEAAWEPFGRYLPECDHPLWKHWSHEAQMSGHGGGDFLVLEEFVSSVEERRRPAVDVYDAVTWSSIFPLSMESRARGGCPVAFPNFRKNAGGAPQ